MRLLKGALFLDQSIPLFQTNHGLPAQLGPCALLLFKSLLRNPCLASVLHSQGRTGSHLRQLGCVRIVCCVATIIMGPKVFIHLMSQCSPDHPLQRQDQVYTIDTLAGKRELLAQDGKKAPTSKKGAKSCIELRWSVRRLLPHWWRRLCCPLVSRQHYSRPQVARFLLSLFPPLLRDKKGPAAEQVKSTPHLDRCFLPCCETCQPQRSIQRAGEKAPNSRKRAKSLY
jgi:hypothetical protein